MKKTMLVMAMVIALAMSTMATAVADDEGGSGRYPALAKSDCDSYHGEWTRDNGVTFQIGEDSTWVGPIRTCVIVTEETEVETLQIGGSPLEFESTLTYEVTTIYQQIGDRNDNPFGVEGFLRSENEDSRVLLNCTDPGAGDGIWLPGENNCPTN